MAYAKVNLKHENTGKMKEAPVGFSWTVLFFGPFPAMFRGDWKWFFMITLAALVTGGLSTFVFMFIYNKFSLKDLLMKTYKVTNLTNISEDSLSLYVGVDIRNFIIQPEEAPA